MLPIKINLSEELATKLRNLRISTPVNGEILTAEKLSKAIGNNRAWMSQIESRRLKNIKREDLISIYKLLFSLSSNDLAESKAEQDLLDYILPKDSKIRIRMPHSQEATKAASRKTYYRDRDTYVERLCNNICNNYIHLYTVASPEIKDQIAHQLLFMFYNSFKGNYKTLDIMSRIPFYLLESATEEEENIIIQKAQELHDLLLSQGYKENLKYYNRSINNLSDALNNYTEDFSIFMIENCFHELAKLIYDKNSKISLPEKVENANKFINLLQLYSQKIDFPFSINNLTPTISFEELDNAMKYIQSFMNIISKRNYYTGSISEYYK